MKTLNKDQVDSLSLIVNPVEKLRFALKEGLENAVRESLEEVIGCYTSRFLHWPHNPWEDSLDDVYLRLHDDSSAEGKQKKLKPEMVVLFYPPTGGDMTLALALDELIIVLGWEHTNVVDKLIKPTLRSYVAHVIPGTPDITLAREPNGVIDVCRRFLHEEDILYQQVHIWALKHYLRNPHGDIRYILHARELCGLPFLSKGSGEPDGLDPVVDKLASLGLSRDDICKEFLSYLTSPRRKWGCLEQNPWFVPYIGAKCFPKGHRELKNFLIEVLMPIMWKDFISGRETEGRLKDFKRIMNLVIDRAGLTM